MSAVKFDYKVDEMGDCLCQFVKKYFIKKLMFAEVFRPWED